MPNLLSSVYVKRNYETRRISHLFGQQSNVVMTYECCVDPQKERSTYGCFRGGSDWFEQKSRQPCLVPKRRKKTAKTGSWQSQERGASFRHQSLHLVVRATFTGLGIAALDTSSWQWKEMMFGSKSWRNVILMIGSIFGKIPQRSPPSISPLPNTNTARDFFGLKDAFAANPRPPSPSFSLLAFSL